MSKKISTSDDLTVEVDFTMEWDERGFSINCELLDGNEHFGEHLIPSMVIHYVRGLCREMGLSFEQVLRSSMGMPPTTYKERIEA